MQLLEKFSTLRFSNGIFSEHGNAELGCYLHRRIMDSMDQNFLDYIQFLEILAKSHFSHPLTENPESTPEFCQFYCLSKAASHR